MNGNLVTVLSPNCYSAVQTSTQTQTEPEVFRKHLKGMQASKYPVLHSDAGVVFKRGSPRIITRQQVSRGLSNDVKSTMI